MPVFYFSDCSIVEKCTIVSLMQCADSAETVQLTEQTLILSVRINVCSVNWTVSGAYLYTLSSYDLNTNDLMTHYISCITVVCLLRRQILIVHVLFIWARDGQMASFGKIYEVVTGAC